MHSIHYIHYFLGYYCSLKFCKISQFEIWNRTSEPDNKNKNNSVQKRATMIYVNVNMSIYVYLHSKKENICKKRDFFYCYDLSFFFDCLFCSFSNSVCVSTYASRSVSVTKEWKMVNYPQGIEYWISLALATLQSLHTDNLQKMYKKQI